MKDKLMGLLIMLWPHRAPSTAGSPAEEATKDAARNDRLNRLERTKADIERRAERLGVDVDLVRLRMERERKVRHHV